MALTEAGENSCFYFGEIRLKNLQELRDALKEPSNILLAKNYVTDYKNDYANWIKDVLKEEALAEKLYKEKNVEKIADLIEEKLLQEQGSREITEEKPADKKEVTSSIEPQEIAKEELSKEKVEPATTTESVHTLDESINHEHHEELLPVYNESEHVHLDKEVKPPKVIAKEAHDARHFCPKFFDCMKREFMYGFAIGTVVGIVAVVILRVGFS